MYAGIPAAAGMKRATGIEEDTDTLKKPRQDGGAKVRVLVLGRYCGALIGKGGENFKRLREHYGVKITGLSSKANERVLQLDGDREHCVSIIQELLPLCPEGPFPAQSTKCATELNILVNTDHVGSIIGKGGSRMKEISTKSGCRLKVYQECLPNSNERVVSIGGEDAAQIVAGLCAVLDILDTYPKKTPTAYFRPDDDNTKTTKMTSMGGGANNNLIGALQQVGALPMPNVNFANELFGTVKAVTTLTVPNDMCGAIIGQGGMNIRQVRQSSGAIIDFSKNDFTKNEAGTKTDRIITLSGRIDQIQVAQQLMSQSASNSNFQQTPESLYV